MTEKLSPSDVAKHINSSIPKHRRFIEAALIELVRLNPDALDRAGPLCAIWDAPDSPQKAPAPASATNPSPAAWVAPARAIVSEFEGCRLEAYRCPVGVWTIGYGATGDGIMPGTRWTQEQADWRFNSDLQRFYSGLVELLPMIAGWTPNRIAALVSWAFNVGLGAVSESTLRTRLLSGERTDVETIVSQELMRWNKGDSGELPGLTRRRAAEIALFKSGEPQKRPIPIVISTPTDKTEWATSVKALNLSQPDALTCQSACIGMAVGEKDVMKIRRQLLAIGEAGSPAVMGQVAKSYTKNYSYSGNASLDEVYDWLRQGNFLITHGWFTPSGHVICFDGLKYDSFSGKFSINVKDPWSEFNFPSWKYSGSSKFYDGFYSELGIYAACVKGTSATNSYAVYKAGSVDRKMKKMWVHRFW